jgi:hypothetical protein
MKAQRVSAEKFVSVYSANKNIDRIAKVLNMNPRYVANRAYELRRNGVAIPKPTEKVRSKKSFALAGR